VSRRGLVFWVVAGLVIVLMVVLAPRAESPEATLAVRRYLADIGLQVVDAARLPPPGGTFILLNDLRDGEQAGPLLRWAQRGGRLVVADPGSVIVTLVGASPAGPIGLVGTADLEPGCLAPEVAGVERIVARASDVALVPSHDEFVSCFPAGEGAYLLTRRYGAGQVTLLGGLSPLTNEMLRAEDNAMLALQVASPGPDVVFGPPVPVGAAPQGSAWSLLPDRARAVVVALILAAVGFALVQARRLGRPVIEEPVAPIPASELVRATARMHRRARTAAYCGRLLRDAVAARLSRGLGGAGRAEDLSRILARAGRVPEERVEEILRGPDPTSDEELIHLGRELEELTARTKEVSP
jgi:hypothetical protein